MRIIRNLPILAWWLFCIALLIKCPVFVCVVALLFLASMPFRKFFLPEEDHEPRIDPLLGITKYSVLQSMTAISMVKASVYANGKKRGETAPVSTTKMLDISSKGEQ